MVMHRLEANLCRRSAFTRNQVFATFLLAYCCLFSGCSSPAKIPHAAGVPVAANAVNLNSASPAQLADLPGLGPRLAARIVEHRERFGKFRKPEQLLLIEGISAEKFEAIRSMVRVD